MDHPGPLSYCQTLVVDFDHKEDEIKNVAVWICLPSLPIHLYDKKCLTFLGKKVGKTIKVDATTMS